MADEARLDRIADGFSQVIDAKSHWTYRHSAGVARLAAGLSTTLGHPAAAVRQVRRAALVHDIGKLGVSNLILDKPGKLTDAERAEMKRHPFYTHQILSRVDGFRDLADMAASHHERLDGRGYHRGLTGRRRRPAGPRAGRGRHGRGADRHPALPGRPATDAVLKILRRDVGPGICPAVFRALEHLAATGRLREPEPATSPVRLAA